MKMQHRQLDTGRGILIDASNDQFRRRRCPGGGAGGHSAEVIYHGFVVNTRRPDAQLSSKTVTELRPGAGLFFA
jgi:hypothetical protein